MTNYYYYYTVPEIREFLRILQEYKHVVRSKEGYGIKEQDCIWSEICIKYNQSPLIRQKSTVQQLQKLWTSINQRKVLTRGKQARVTTDQRLLEEIKPNIVRTYEYFLKVLAVVMTLCCFLFIIYAIGILKIFYLREPGYSFYSVPENEYLFLNSLYHFAFTFFLFGSLLGLFLVGFHYYFLNPSRKNEAPIKGISITTKKINKEIMTPCTEISKEYIKYMKLNQPNQISSTSKSEQLDNVYSMKQKLKETELLKIKVIN
ncbi:PREDICTED: uncharacterized protein LOC105562107 isoform X2 [Vollenhovia emeryi]|nr:PREDICTED: uncharacterized protein LOC105562107 isoform X2 [Vollenhovia emeryi]